MDAPKVHLSEEIKREVGQHFVFGFHGFEVSENVKTLIRDYYVGNIILMKRNIQSAQQTRKLVEDLQSIAKEAGHKRPLLIGIDQENGLVSAFSSPTAGTQFPGAMAIAATGSTDLAEQVARASATELKMVGINWVFSPVADVNTDSRNPVIGVRSFGDDPNKVAQMVVAASRGTAAVGVAPTGKHFPGHGDTHVDSHLALPKILKTKSQMVVEELVPFAALISEAGVPCVMTGHMALPVLTGDDTPASLSRTITTGVLRDECAFEGVVVTDCLEMDAIADEGQGGCGVREGAVRALEAGADVVMICHTFERHTEAVGAAYRAIEEDRISVDVLTKSGERIARMKDKFAGGWREVAPASDPELWDQKFRDLQSVNLKLSREIYPQTTTIVWNAGKVVPLDARAFQAEKHLLLLTPAVEAVNRAVDPGDGTLIGPHGPRNTAGASYLALARAVEKRAKLYHAVYAAGDAVVDDILDGVGGLIFVMRNADLRRWQMEYLGRLHRKMKEMRVAVPVILLASCGPYDLTKDRETYEGWTAYVATYEFTAEAFEAAVGVVFGETAGGGSVPVNLI